MKERILADLRQPDIIKRIKGKTDMEIYDYICYVFFLRDDEYAVARECSIIIWKEINNLN